MLWRDGFVSSYSLTLATRAPNEMSMVALPHYSPPPSPAPDYSVEPAIGEITLQRSPRYTQRTPRSTFVRKDGHITIVLTDQEDGALFPTYGRHSMITGEIIFQRADYTYEVALHISGKLETICTEGGPNVIPLLDKKVVLWNTEIDNNGFDRPTKIKFSIQLPGTFDDDGEARRLPPSYRVDFDTLPAMMVRSSYALQFSFSRSPSRKLGLFNKRKLVFIPFQYYPRTRPQRPLLYSHCFLSDIKYSPEEWYQAMIAVKVPGKSELPAVYFHLFVPASCIYSICDPIPFHLQVNGPIESMRVLLYAQQDEKLKSCASRHGGAENPSSSEMGPWVDRSSYQIKTPLFSRFSTQSSRVSSSSTSSSFLSGQVQNLPKESKTDDKRPTPRVSLLRQVTIQSKDGKVIRRNQVMGESKPRLVPPLPDTDDVNGPVSNYLDWEGILRVGKEFRTGSFKAANVNVKDYIAISIIPHNEATSPLQDLEVKVPIKLVTDSFMEDNSIAVV